MPSRLLLMLVAISTLALAPAAPCEAAERLLHAHPGAAGPAAAPPQGAPHGEPARADRVLFKNPIAPDVYELPSGALATWRKFAAEKPSLVLFSAHPLLSPVPEDDLDEIDALLRSGSAADLSRRGLNTAADTLFVSPQTVSVAIQGGLISELVYVLPTTRKVEAFSLQDFQQRATAAGFLTTAEAEALIGRDGVISGTVRGIPLRCVHPAALPKIEGPVLVHFDLSYFKDLYVNDVKTPVYALLENLVKSIQELDYRVYAATLSYSNQEALLSLDTRFMISNLAEIIRQPALLKSGTPASWGMRAEALYASAMFADSHAQELTVQAAESSPDDADAAYALAQLLFSRKQPDEGFRMLDRAVSLDRGYAYAYYELAYNGIELGEIGKSLKLLEKAAELLADNPFIRMQLADLLIQTGRGQEALPMLAELRALNWSERYHVGVTERLAEMEAAARQPSQ